MRFYNEQHQYYCGIDLHARSLYVCVLDPQGDIVLHQNLKADGDTLLAVLEPFREDVVIGCECMFAWYWIADLCSRRFEEPVCGHGVFSEASGKAPVKKFLGEKEDS